MSGRKQDIENIIAGLEDQNEGKSEICAVFSPQDAKLIREVLRASLAEDKTAEYAAMLERFECDFNLAEDPESGKGLDDLQVQIERKDERMLADIDLLRELSYGIRHGKIKIMQQEEETSYKAHWVSFIIQDRENSKPWLCAINTSCGSLKEAKKIIARQRQNYRVLSAWVDVYDERAGKITIFHANYINAIGTVARPGISDPEGGGCQD